jgi:hypothetical protein
MKNKNNNNFDIELERVKKSIIPDSVLNVIAPVDLNEIKNEIDDEVISLINSLYQNQKGGEKYGTEKNNLRG